MNKCRTYFLFFSLDAATEYLLNYPLTPASLRFLYDKIESCEAQKSLTENSNDSQKESHRIRSNTFTVQDFTERKSEKQTEGRRTKIILIRIGAILFMIGVIVGLIMVFLHMFGIFS